MLSIETCEIRMTRPRYFRDDDGVKWKRWSRDEELLRRTPPRSPIRVADQHDEIGIIELFQTMHAEQPYHDLDLPSISAMVRLAVQPGPQRRGIIGVIGERHDLKGGVFLLMEKLWYSKDWQINEYFNFVRPDARKGTHYAQDLIAYAQQCSDQIGLDLFLGVFSTIRTEAKCRLYRRYMPKVGEFYLHVPPNRKPVYERIAGSSFATAAE